MVESPILSGEAKSILKEALTKPLESMGLIKSDNEYLWFSDFNKNGIKFVFKYVKLKGETGVFSWGTCFEFVQTYNGSRKLVNHKTDKSTKLHLFEWPEGYRKSFEGGGKPTELISHWGRNRFVNSLENVLNKYKPIIAEWYKKASTLEGCLEILDEQILKKGSYKGHFPNQKYVKMFILIKLGNITEAQKEFDYLKDLYINHDNSWISFYEDLENKIFA